MVQSSHHIPAFDLFLQTTLNATAISDNRYVEIVAPSIRVVKVPSYEPVVAPVKAMLLPAQTSHMATQSSREDMVRVKENGFSRIKSRKLDRVREGVISIIQPSK